MTLADGATPSRPLPTDLRRSTVSKNYTVGEMYTVSDETLRSILENDSTGDWAALAEVGRDTFTWTEREGRFDHSDPDFPVYVDRTTATFQELATVLLRCAIGAYGDGEKLSPELREQAREIMRTGDATGMDVNNYLIQFALFGDIRYD
jgi:hypothetical protein